MATHAGRRVRLEATSVAVSAALSSGQSLQGRVRFHPLAVEDADHFGQRPKADVYDDYACNYVSLVIHGARTEAAALWRFDPADHPTGLTRPSTTCPASGGGRTGSRSATDTETRLDHVVARVEGDRSCRLAAVLDESVVDPLHRARAPTGAGAPGQPRPRAMGRSEQGPVFEGAPDAVEGHAQTAGDPTGGL